MTKTSTTGRVDLREVVIPEAEMERLRRGLTVGMVAKRLRKEPEYVRRIELHGTRSEHFAKQVEVKCGYSAAWFGGTVTVPAIYYRSLVQAAQENEDRVIEQMSRRCSGLVNQAPRTGKSRGDGAPI